MGLENTSIPGIQQRVLTNGDISWYGKFRDPITKASDRKKLGTKNKDGIKTAKDALIALNKFLEARKSFNNDTISEQFEYQNYLTLDDLAKKYFDERLNVKRRILREQYQHIISDEDFENYRVVKDKLYAVRNEVIRYETNVGSSEISKLNVNTITKAHINTFIGTHLYERNLSQKTKFLIISLMKTIINHAIQEDIISIKNPLEHIKFKNPKRQRERVLTEGEIAELLRECKTHKDNLNVYLSVYLAVLTGGRVNTVLNIRKKDFDLKNRFVSLYNFKANRKYRLRISENAVQWLENKILPHYQDDEFIIRAIRECYRKSPPQPMTEVPKAVYTIMDTLFNEGLNKQNNDDRDKVVNFHTIRRSIATNLAKNGTPLYDVMIFLNHSNIEQTMKYLNTDSNELHANVNILMDNIFKDFKGVSATL